MAIKEPGHGLIMIRRVHAHDRGLSVPVCVHYMYINMNLGAVSMKAVQICRQRICVSGLE